MYKVNLVYLKGYPQKSIDDVKRFFEVLKNTY